MLESLDNVSGYRAREIAALRDAIRANAIIPSDRMQVQRMPGGTTLIPSADPLADETYPFGSRWAFGFVVGPSDSSIAQAAGNTVWRVSNPCFFGADWFLDSAALDYEIPATGSIVIGIKIQASFSISAGSLSVDGISAESIDALREMAEESDIVIPVASFEDGSLVRDYVHGAVMLPVWAWIQAKQE